VKTLFRNGSIHTMNGTEVVHSLLVEDGRILDVNCDVPAGECQVVDLHGKTVLPGFHDSHEHFLCYATDKEKINFFGIRSLEEMAERTRRYIADRGIKKGEWIQGGGWNENEFDVPVLPSRQDLDKFCPDNPAIFTRTCCSVAVANTAALKAAGIFDDIPTLQDGHIVVDENGVPTGMLHERARHLVYDILTKYTKEQLKQFILDYQKDLLSTGLTTVQTDDFKLWDATIDDILAAYEELDKEGKLNVRFIQQLRLITDAQLDAMEADNRGCAEALDKHDVGAYFRHLDEFNGLLTQSSNMPLLIKLLDQIESYSATTSFQNPEHARFRESVLSDDERRRRALAEHEEIVASLRARDADRLRRVLTAHTANVHEAALQRYGKED